MSTRANSHQHLRYNMTQCILESKKMTNRATTLGINIIYSYITKEGRDLMVQGQNWGIFFLLCCSHPKFVSTD